MSDKVYAVNDTVNGAETLVRAAGLQTAIAHVAAKQFTGKLLKSGELLDRIDAGATVEKAREPAHSPAPTPEAKGPPGSDVQGAAQSGGGKDGSK
jgi:hypothetical protein